MSESDTRGLAIIKADRIDQKLGIFKSYEEIPSQYRLESYSGQYEGKDPFNDYLSQKSLSNRHSRDSKRFARRWKSHMENRGRHYALANPDDVESWAESLLSRYSLRQSKDHFCVIDGFYQSLLWNVNHPHTYNPFRLAARNRENSRQIWIKREEMSIRR